MPPATKDVQINITTNTMPNAPWKKATASNSTDYYYMWVGGNVRPPASPNGVGNNQFSVGPANSFPVTFVGNDGATYKFTAFAQLTGPKAGEITGVATAAQITVTDACTEEGTYTWGATIALVADDSVTFDVDPVISNTGSGPRLE